MRSPLSSRTNNRPPAVLSSLEVLDLEAWVSDIFVSVILPHLLLTTIASLQATRFSDRKLPGSALWCSDSVYRGQPMLPSHDPSSWGLLRSRAGRQLPARRTLVP